MGIFLILAAVIIMVVAFMTVGVLNTLLIAASGGIAFWYFTKGKNGANGNGNGNGKAAYVG